MAVTLRYFTELGKYHAFQHITAPWWNLCTSLLHFVVRVRCCRKESSRSLSYLLMSFLFFFYHCHAFCCKWPFPRRINPFKKCIEPDCIQNAFINIACSLELQFWGSLGSSASAARTKIVPVRSITQPSSVSLVSCCITLDKNIRLNPSRQDSPLSRRVL